MAFDTGHKKSGGRTAGTPNQNMEFKALIKERVSVDDLLATIEQIQSPSKKVDAYLKLLSFVYPKPKAIELKAEQSNEIKELQISFVTTGTEPEPASNENDVVL